VRLFPRFERFPHSPRERAFLWNQRMASLPYHLIAEAIDTAPLNRGLKGRDWLAHPGNVPVTFDNGDIALFDHEGDGIFQVHFLFESRGREAIRHAKESFEIMFTEHGASLIIGLVPDFRRDVKMLARWAGGRSSGMRKTPNGPCELFVLSKIQWKVANQ
jgi:hypothetical protein